MGTSTDAKLIFGYHFGAEEGLLLREAQESDSSPYGLLKTDWFDGNAGIDDDRESEDFFEAATKRLYDSIDGAPPAEDDWDRQGVVKERLGVWFESHCSVDYPMYVLATKVYTACRGDADVVNLPELTDGIGEWTARLAHALSVLGVTPTEERPEWLLCSDWG